MKDLLHAWEKFRTWYRGLDKRVQILILSFLSSAIIHPWFVAGYMVRFLDVEYSGTNDPEPKDVWVSVSSALIGMIVGGLVNCLIYSR
jgi:RsiW-degrading membrane proteinase PrsW (M82 family)